MAKRSHWRPQIQIYHQIHWQTKLPTMNGKIVLLMSLITKCSMTL